jgi:hypothetical protein
MKKALAGRRVGRWALVARRAGVAAIALAVAVMAAPLRAQTAPSKPTMLKFDSVNAVIRSLVPPRDRNNVKNIKLSAAGKELQVEADVRMSAVPGMEMMSALGFAHVTGVGPVNLIKPGQVGWLIRTIEVAGAPISSSLWGPLVRKGTKRTDNYIVFPVGEWVKGVEVQPGGLRLY